VLSTLPPDALIFEANTFVNMDDTPANYTDAANKILKVNSGGTAVEFVTAGTVRALRLLGTPLLEWHHLDGIEHPL